MPADGLTLARDGVEVLDGYLAAEECRRVLGEVEAYAAARELPVIRRDSPGRSLHYRVIDGDRIHAELPRLVGLYDAVARLARGRSRRPDLAPLANRAASVNVNLTPPGGEYRWHYDRNAVTAILYLNAVEGGETEVYPNYRLHLGRFKDTAAQCALDRLLQAPAVLRRFGRKLAVAPLAGRLILMRGDRCLHSVRPVAGERQRVNVIMTFDTPRIRFRAECDLDPYLYSRRPSPGFDPNYRP
jgi:hypothetical protein